VTSVRSCANLAFFSGTILSLRHHKDIVTEAKKDSECGVTFRDWDQFEVGDQLQAIEEVRERPKLSVGQTYSQ
jgi:translation initiation factor IF-2